MWVYAALMLGTIIWSVWEVGTDFWALAPRLDILGILGLWLLVPAVTRGINNLGSNKVTYIFNFSNCNRVDGLFYLQ